MSNVRSEPIKAPRARLDWPILLARVGVWIAVAAFGGIVWAVNGGFSVLGLQTVARSFNDAGALFWAAASALRFTVPVQVSGLPATQPLVPWLVVIAASLVQVVALTLKLRGRALPIWLWLAVFFLSVYDLATTFAGLGTLTWIRQAGVAVQVLLTIVLTFVVESVVSLLARR